MLHVEERRTTSALDPRNRDGQRVVNDVGAARGATAAGRDAARHVPSRAAVREWSWRPDTRSRRRSRGRRRHPGQASARASRTRAHRRAPGRGRARGRRSRSRPRSPARASASAAPRASADPRVGRRSSDSPIRRSRSPSSESKLWRSATPQAGNPSGMIPLPRNPARELHFGGAGRGGGHRVSVGRRGRRRRAVRGAQGGDPSFRAPTPVRRGRAARPTGSPRGPRPSGSGPSRPTARCACDPAFAAGSGRPSRPCSAS